MATVKENVLPEDEAKEALTGRLDFIKNKYGAGIGKMVEFIGDNVPLTKSLDPLINSLSTENRQAVNTALALAYPERYSGAPQPSATSNVEGATDTDGLPDNIDWQEWYNITQGLDNGTSAEGIADGSATPGEGGGVDNVDEILGGDLLGPIATKEESEPNPLLDAALEQLTNNLDTLSSQESEFDKTLTEIVSDLRSGQKASERGVKASFERARGEVAEKGEIARTRARELQKGVGPASAFALNQRIDDAIEKDMRDLDLREQEALATGRMEVADRIANIKLSKLEFANRLKQQNMQNALSLAGLGMQQEQFEMQKDEFGFDRAQKQIKILEGFGLLSKLDDSSKRSFEQSMGLPQGSFDRIVPRSNEEFLFKEVNETNGNVTAVFRDRNSGKMREEVFEGIALRASGGQDLSPAQETNRKIQNWVAEKEFLLQQETGGERPQLTPEQYALFAQAFARDFSAEPGVSTRTIETFFRLFSPELYMETGSLNDEYIQRLQDRMIREIYLPQ